MKLSACMIMRDAAADIADSLESVRDGADEIVVVDTGSRDESMEIARRYTDKVFSFEWGEDFAAARNFCLDRATGDWVIFLDSDEFLTRETRGNLRRLTEALDAQGIFRVMVRRENVDECNLPVDADGDFSLRLFRNDGKHRYRDPIHEFLDYSGEGEDPYAVLAPYDLMIHHRGYAPDRVAGKMERNSRMLDRMEAEGKEKLFLEYYRSGTYFYERDYGETLASVEKVISSGRIPGEDAFGIWRLWLAALRKANSPEEERERVLKLCMEKCPDLPDLYVHYGELLLKRGDADGAWEQFQKAQEARGELVRKHPMENDLSREEAARLYHGMAEVCLRRGGADEARRYAGMEWESLGELKRRREARPEFTGWIPADSRTVVEFGCGEGAAGRAFLRRCPEACYIGADTEEEALRAAAHSLSRVVSAAPDALDFAGLGLERVDCLVYQDSVLRELTTGCLRRHREMLSEKGQMLFVLENPGYFRHLANAFSAKGSFRGSGVSLSELRQRIGEAGLAVFDVQPVYAPGDEAELERPETREALRALAAWQEGSPGADVRACRFLLRAAKKEPGKKVFLQVLSAEPLVSGRLRVSDPCGFLQAAPGFSCRIEGKSADMRLGQEFEGRLFLRHRCCFEDATTGLRQLSALRQGGRLIVYETDDHPLRWKAQHEKSWFLDFIAAHAVQVPTQALADAVRQYNPHVRVLRNELAELPPPRVYDEKEPVTIFFGAVNREQDGQELLPALREAAQKYGDRIRFKVLSDRSFFDGLAARDKEFIGNPAWYGGKLVPYEVYARELGTADIVLLPLRDTVFHRVKSDILFLEAAAHGAVVLASPVVYGDTVKDGRTGFLYRSREEFYHRLCRLIEERPRRRKMAEYAYDYVKKERMLSRHYGERVAFYEEILARKDELEHDLTLRLARLAKRLGSRA